jgi:hypothetical protein
MGMNKLAAMQTFLAIVDEGSLTAAADAQGKALPTVVRSLATLEAQLGVGEEPGKLFGELVHGDPRRCRSVPIRPDLTEASEEALFRRQNVRMMVQSRAQP